MLVGRGMFLFRLLNLLACWIFLARCWLYAWPLANWLPPVCSNGWGPALCHWAWEHPATTPLDWLMRKQSPSSQAEGAHPRGRAVPRSQTALSPAVTALSLLVHVGKPAAFFFLHFLLVLRWYKHTELLLFPRGQAGTLCRDTLSSDSRTPMPAPMSPCHPLPLRWALAPGGSPARQDGGLGSNRHRPQRRPSAVE